MHPVEEDVWTADVEPDVVGAHEVVVEAWRDRFATWRHDIEVKVGAGQDVTLELEEGARLLEKLSRGVDKVGRQRVLAAAEGLRRDTCSLAGPAQRRPRRPGGRAGGPGARRRRLHRGPAAVGRPAPGRVRCLVRAVPPVRGRLRRGGQAPAGHRRHGLRHRLPAADPPDRHDRPQGPEQHAGAGPRRSGQPVGHRLARGRPHRDRTRASARSRTSTGSAARRPTWAWRWRSTTPCSARPTTPGWPSTPSGSTSGPTARSATPRTRPRSTRTSTRSTSGRPARPTGWRCGRPAATSCATGSTRASAPSGSTTPTPSRWPSGPG